MCFTAQFAKKFKSILAAETYADFSKLLSESDCPRCAELAKSRTNIVVDRGNPKAKIMLIGEAPGKDEDIQKKAFVGRAGKKLDEVMSKAGIDTNRETIIANVVKCRPSNNRAPRKNEAESCLPYLKRQIELIKPKIIVLMGTTAFKNVCGIKGTVSVKKEAGKIFKMTDYPGVEFMLVYHPAYLLYDPKRKKDFEAYIRTLKNFLRSSSRKA